MMKYKLYGEWRDVVRIGTDLADALMRGKTLQQPDKTEHGAVFEIAKIHYCGPAPYSHGSDKVERAIIEFTDGQIKEVDGRLIEEIN